MDKQKLNGFGTHKKKRKKREKKNAPNWARTSDLSVNSRALYHLSHKSLKF